MKQLTVPDFIFCENPIKTGDIVEDNRAFIFCSKYLSLIEVIPMDLFIASYPSELPQKTFFYGQEEFLLVLVINNIQFNNIQNEIEILKGNAEPMQESKLLDLAWDFYSKYLEWEDLQ